MDTWETSQIYTGGKQLATSVLGKFITVTILDKLDSELRERKRGEAHTIPEFKKFNCPRNFIPKYFIL